MALSDAYNDVRVFIFFPKRRSEDPSAAKALLNA